jgi:hypothetical protein
MARSLTQTSEMDAAGIPLFIIQAQPGGSINQAFIREWAASLLEIE